ncbi:MAG: cytochrome c [Cephaloticoccus sp.]|nr:cytochrome c [Cephaloticoccus sp.]MCF7761900.1 cytochrome c [Cephaloticoccus sp.]
MSAEQPQDPRLEQAAATDDSLISVHEKASAGTPDTHAHYRLLPLALLFIFSGLIFFGGTYLNRYSGHFHSEIFDERQLPGQGGAATVTKIDPIALGKKQYNSACITCHMPNGQGLPNVYPPLAGSEWVQGSEERVISILLHGLKGPVTVLGKTYSAAAMPAFGQVAGGGYNWSDEKIAAVLTYIRQEWGNTAGPIDAAKVTELRLKEANRKEWSEAELLELP